MYDLAVLDLQRLKVLRAVVTDGSIHGAAASLGYSPSAISQQVSALQKATGLVLIERSGRGIEPTAAARRLADEAGRIFQNLSELEGLVTDLRAGRIGTLTVSYFASAGATWLPPAIAAVTRAYPRLRLDLRLTGQGDTHQSDIEIFVEGSTPPPPQAGYLIRRLVEEPYHVVVRRDSELATHDRIPLRALAGHHWIDNDAAHGPCRQIILGACAAAGFAPTFRVETPDYLTAIQFVAEGLGITVLPRLGLGALPSSVVAVPVTDPVPIRRIALRFRTAIIDNPAAGRLLLLLEAQALAGSPPAPSGSGPTPA